MSKIPHRLYLTEDQMPQKWFNLRSAMAEQPDPLLHPGTLRPLGVDDLSPIFCEELARQELDGATAYVDIPEPIQNVYKMYRPSPLIRAYELLPTVQFIDFRRFPPPFVPEICQIPEVTCVPLRRDFSCSGSDSGSELQSGLRICAT